MATPVVNANVAAKMAISSDTPTMEITNAAMIDATMKTVGAVGNILFLLAHH